MWKDIRDELPALNTVVVGYARGSGWPGWERCILELSPLVSTRPPVVYVNNMSEGYLDDWLRERGDCDIYWHPFPELPPARNDVED